MRRSTFLAALGAAISITACSGDKGDIVTVVSRGALRGIVYMDWDGDRTLTEGDAALPGIALQLVPVNRATVTATTTSQENGTFLFQDVPVGRYTVQPSSIPDTLELAGIDSSSVAVAKQDTSAVAVGLGYPHVSVSDARALAAGRGAFIEGVALTGWTTFGDSTLHIRGGAAAIRVLRVEATATNIADSVRILGRAATVNGQPVLGPARAFVLAQAEAPQPADTLSTGDAAGAAGGALDADLVAVVSAQITGLAFTSTGDIRVTVDDGSGPLDVNLDASVPITLAFNGDPTLYRVDATGVLVPKGDGSWALKPRVEADLTLIAP